jgi:5-methylcytosine-specific restriction enzyme B
MSTESYSEACLEVLRMLKDQHNVLVSGPPASGKSRLINEVATAFGSLMKSGSSAGGPVLKPSAPVPIPATPSASIDPVLQPVMPSAARLKRQVFRTVFHQNSKYRDFLTGIAPQLGTSAGFRTTKGILYRASECAMQADGAALLIIDEINRGPAVQVFGGAIVAIEPEKRLAPNGQPQRSTQFFELIDPSTGDMIEYAFPHHLYILAAMNQADVSVEPLDVAFLRRWAPYPLGPNEGVLRAYFGLPAQPQTLPQSPASAMDAYEAAVQAWAKINARIAIGRGGEFEVGHGLLMGPGQTAPADLNEALLHVARAWNAVRAHLAEVFFGDLRGLAAALNALGNVSSHPYKVEDAYFADEPRSQLVGPASATAENIYAILVAVAQ